MKISLRAARVNAGLTQREVGDLLEYSHTIISKWEDGSLRPRKLYLDALAKLYSIPVENLDLTPNPQKPKKS